MDVDSDYVNDIRPIYSVIRSGEIRQSNIRNDNPDVSEEARTRGFPSSPFGGSGYIVAATKYSRKLPDGLLANRIGIYTGSSNVRSDQVLGGPIDR